MPRLRLSVLAGVGPVVDVVIAPAGLPFIGPPVPNASLKMLIDTGADVTHVCESLIAPWNLLPTAPYFGRSSHGQGMSRTFDLSVAVQNPSGNGSWFTPSLDVVERKVKVFDGLSIKGLIGRDILDNVVFTYNGAGGWFAVDY